MEKFENDDFSSAELVRSSEVIHEQFKELFSLSEEEKNHLSERISRWHGKIRIVVHPFFDVYVRREAVDLDVAEKHKATIKTEKIKNILAKMLAMKETETPPIMIMEESAHSAELPREIGDRMEGKTLCNIPYVIETRPNTPIPIGNGEHVMFGENHLAWQELIDKLKEFGVKDILIGGMYLNPEKNSGVSKQLSNFYERCVGDAIEALQKDFKLEKSALTASNDKLS